MNRFSGASMRIFAELAVALSCLATPAIAADRVIYDNDWNVSNGGYVSEPALMLLLTDPKIDLLGLTSVSGDAWRDEGVATLLRFLEIVGAGHVPVYNGAIDPLSNNARRHAAWEARYGKRRWSGAWNDMARDRTAHRDDPLKITPPREGLPRTLRPQHRNAVAFLIDAVHRHPHEITIYAEGPLTNIALAVHQDPDFARLVRRIVILGSSAASDRDDGSQLAEFNIFFDPEAADIVLTAPWPEILVLGNVADRPVMAEALVERIAAVDTPAARFALANASKDLPLWSQVGAAIVSDPTLVRSTVRTVIDVDLSHGRRYGRTRTRPARLAVGSRAVTLVTAIDAERLVEAYVRSLAKPVVRAAPAR